MKNIEKEVEEFLEGINWEELLQNEIAKEYEIQALIKGFNKWEEIVEAPIEVEEWDGEINVDEF